MDSSNFPTKRNLLDAKQSLYLAKQGYDLLDKKRTVLLIELNTIKKASQILCDKLEAVLQGAHDSLTQANMFMGESSVKKICNKTAIDTSLHIHLKNIMGVSIPQIDKNNAMISSLKLPYGLGESTTYLDKAYVCWMAAKSAVFKYAETETAIMRLSKEINRTQKKASALKNITIPKYEARIKYIAEQLEERERDELVRIRVLIAAK